jgi:neutral amino acid transport system permease protein
MVGYLVFLVISTAIYALFSLGLNLQWGFTGLINFGYVGFIAIGAYATVLLSLVGVPLMIAALLGGALAAVLGLVIGFSTLRLREDYLAIVTIGVSEIIRLIALNEEWLTRGAFGIQRYPLPLAALTQPNLPSRIVMIAILTIMMVAAYWQWWKWLRQQLQQSRSTWSRLFTVLSNLALAAFGIWVFVVCAISLSNFAENPTRNGLMLVSVVVVAVVYWALERLVRSPWGRILKAIREDEMVAKALGKDVFWYKLQSLMIGGFIGGISGALYAWQLSSVYPENFAPLITFHAWTIVVLGGAGNNAGTILGAIIFWAYNSLTRFLDAVLPLDSARLGALRIMLIGLLLMGLMMWRPQGLLGKKEELTLGR